MSLSPAFLRFRARSLCRGWFVSVMNASASARAKLVELHDVADEETS